MAADGKVGIGTTNPAYLLDVAGPVRSTTGGFVFPDGTMQTSAAGASFWASSGGNISNTNTGNVGIGIAAPTNLLNIAGGSSDGRIQFTNNTTGNGYLDGLWIGVDSGQHYVLGREDLPLTLFTNATERIRVAADGKAGIGTRSPADALDVAETGNLRLS